MKKILSNQNEISAALRKARTQRFTRPKGQLCGNCPNYKTIGCFDCLKVRNKNV